MADIERTNVDAYVVARFAEWAGDVEYSRKLYAEFGRGTRYYRFPEQFDGPVEVIRFVSELRAARLGKPVPEETRLLANEVFAVEEEGISTEAAKPVALEPTTHLRAVVHRVGTRDFEMRGYLSAPDFERHLYANAAALGARPLATDLDALDSDSIYSGPGGAWVIEGTLFQQVAVSDFGLIKSRGRWTRAELPRDAREVLDPFQRLLDALDPVRVQVSVREGQ